MLDQQLGQSLARIYGIKAIQPSATPGVLDVLIAPFWGPNGGRDAHGQFFTPRTNFLHDVIPRPPVFYFHGAELGGDATIIGKAGDRWTDDLGVWQTVTLDMAQPDARRTWQAALTGNAYASTGVVPASLMINQQTGEIEQWLIGEISLMVMDAQNAVEPANTYAIALPRLKALRASLEPDERRLFDQVYITRPQGATMNILEKLKEFFDRFLGELADELDAPVSEVADIVEEAVADGADAADEGVVMESDPEVESAVEEVLDALDIDEADEEMPLAKSVAALKRQNAQLRKALLEQVDAKWLGEQVKAGRITPAEKPAALKALAAARATGNAATVKAFQRAYEARPGNPQRTTIKARGMKQAGFAGPSPNSVDAETLARMRRYAGIKEN